MKQSNRAVLTAAFALTALTTAASAGNIVTNGDFEAGAYSVTYINNYDLVPNGWTLGPPSYAIQSAIAVSNATNPSIDLGPESGSDYVAFSSPSTSGRDCLYQDLATVAGQEYDISFWVAITNSSVGAASIGLDVEWDENTANQTALDENFYSSPSNTGPIGYQEVTFTELASTSTTRIDFHSVDSAGSILLDNVSVTPDAGTPEPFSMLLAGSGLLAVGLMRRRRAAQKV
jgi:MYXO-CTERM domain-containing protein